MLTKLLPEQIAKFWDIIKYAIEQSLPPIVSEHPDKMNRILSSALSGGVDVWASYTKKEDNVKFEGIVLTRVLHDDVSDTRNLLIYCIYGYQIVDKSSWIHALEMLVKYAISKKCLQIIAYTEFPYIVGIAQHLGADTRYTFISFKVDEIVQNLNGLREIR
jgi:hypothetical protein